MVKFFVLFIVAIFLFAGSGAAAATFEEGVARFDAGDYEGAMKAWLPSAYAGDRDAQYRVGWLYDDGLGVRQDKGIAIEWYLRSALQGAVRAQNVLGYMFDYGIALPKDRDRAKCWYLLAAEQGYPQAQNNLAHFLEPMEEPHGRHYWRSRAARQGHVGAMAIFGWVEWRTSLDKAEGLMYLFLAAERDDSDAIEDVQNIRQNERTKVKRLLSKFEDRAMEMAAAWEPVLEKPPATPPPIPDKCLL